MDTNLHPDPTYKYPNPVPKCHPNPNLKTQAKTTFTLTLPADMGQPSNIPTTSQPIIPHPQITTIIPQPPITSTNTNNTTTMFNKLVELNHSKNDHQQQLTILNKHISQATPHMLASKSAWHPELHVPPQTSCTNTIQRNHPKLMGKSHHFPRT
ncbi:Hypothetical predicted protein [Paramuricea clavata]|uniref:Uncharacterized protein n=1 Tax=Paramuricea clavata TaxID=317549 RepID=A0A7D9IKE2_PARCT|nr:Hypothetical predicted protein [Paramuricea clavata]